MVRHLVGSLFIIGSNPVSLSTTGSRISRVGTRKCCDVREGERRGGEGGGGTEGGKERKEDGDNEFDN